MSSDALLADIWREIDSVKQTETAIASTSLSTSVDSGAASFVAQTPANLQLQYQQNRVQQSQLQQQQNADRIAAERRKAARSHEEEEFRARSIAQGLFHDGICEQIHNLYCRNGIPYLPSDDQTHGICDPREKCEEGVCTGEMYELKLYAVQPDAENDDLLDRLRRQATAKDLYIKDSALECAVRCGMLAGEQFRRSDAEMRRRNEEQKRSQKAKIDHSPYNVMVHACVERFCLLSSTANKTQRDLYDRIHESRMTGANVVRYIYFCRRHVRFHICDQHCDQTRLSHAGSTMCILSATVKSGMEMQFSFGDGTGTDEQRETLADINSMRDTRDTSDAEMDGMTLNPQQRVDIKQRRKAAFGGVTIVRDRSNRGAQTSSTTANGSGGLFDNAASDGSASTTPGRGRGRGGRRRGRGRGRGSIVGGGNRQQTARREMAASLAKSSGDLDSTMTPQEEATKFAQIVSYSNGYSSSVASRDTIVGKIGLPSDAAPSSQVEVSGVAGSGSVTSRKRKVNRARRTGAAAATPPIKITLDVPRYLVETIRIDLTRTSDTTSPSPAIKHEALKRELMPPPPPRIPQQQPSADDDNNDEPEIDEFGAHDPPAATVMHAPLPRVTGIKSEDDRMLNSRLAEPSYCAYELRERQRELDNSTAMQEDLVEVDPEKDLVTVTCSIKPGAPFAERQQNAHDNYFVIDTLQIGKQRAERLARFRLSPQQQVDQGNTFFSTSDLFESYGERACQIIWRLLFSKERGAIERAKQQVCAGRIQGDIASYVSKQSKEHRVLSAEKINRLAWQEYDKASIYKSLVIDLDLCKILETYYALVVIEFYVNLLSLPNRLSLNLDEATSDTIRKQFNFEHLVPAIVGLMRDGLEVKNVTILPKDCFFINEWYPESNTMKQMGIPDQTMTHLRTAISTYIAAADRSHVSMRRFEGTRIDWQELARIRVPGYLPGTESMQPVERADYLANHVVAMFVQRRAKRLNSFTRASNTI